MRVIQSNERWTFESAGSSSHWPLQMFDKHSDAQCALHTDAQCALHSDAQCALHSDAQCALHTDARQQLEILKKRRLGARIQLIHGLWLQLISSLNYFECSTGQFNLSELWKQWVGWRISKTMVGSCRLRRVRGGCPGAPHSCREKSHHRGEISNRTEQYQCTLHIS